MLFCMSITIQFTVRQGHRINITLCYFASMVSSSQHYAINFYRTLNRNENDMLMRIFLVSYLILYYKYKFIFIYAVCNF